MGTIVHLVPGKITGFTGTRNGMFDAQKRSLSLVLAVLKFQGHTVARHGMCIGADAEFHAYVKSMGFQTVGHLGVRRDWKCFTQADVEKVERQRIRMSVAGAMTQLHEQGKLVRERQGIRRQQTLWGKPIQPSIVQLLEESEGRTNGHTEDTSGITSGA